MNDIKTIYSAIQFFLFIIYGDHPNTSILITMQTYDEHHYPPFTPGNLFKKNVIY